jgi:hypothetical protein
MLGFLGIPPISQPVQTSVVVFRWGRLRVRPLGPFDHASFRACDMSSLLILDMRLHGPYQSSSLLLFTPKIFLLFVWLDLSQEYLQSGGRSCRLARGRSCKEKKTAGMGFLCCASTTQARDHNSGAWSPAATTRFVERGDGGFGSGRVRDATVYVSRAANTKRIEWWFCERCPLDIDDEQ